MEDSFGYLDSMIPWLESLHPCFQSWSHEIKLLMICLVCSLAFNVAALLYPFDRYLLRTKLKILSLDSFIGHNVQDSRM